jgi:hypothetical protein
MCPTEEFANSIKSGAGARRHYHSHTLDITVALNRDSAAGDQLVDEYDCGDEQQ